MRFIEDALAVVRTVLPGARIFIFGPVDDGNLHYNVSAPLGTSSEAYLAMRQNEKAISSTICDVVAAANGSISAKHGVGQLRVRSITKYKSGVELAMMRRIKGLFDPQNLFNPGRVVVAD